MIDEKENIKDILIEEEQIEYARSLRILKTGWTTELRVAYFNWFLKAANYRGGRSFSKFIEFIRRDAIASLSAAEKMELKDLLAKKPVVKSPFEIMAAAMIGRKYVKQWELEELTVSLFVRSGLLIHLGRLSREMAGII